MKDSRYAWAAPGAKSPSSYPEPWLIPHSLRPLYRFLLGRPMDNHIRTDATFFHRATTGYPSRWLWLAGWERAVIRLASLYVLAVAGVVLLAAGVSWSSVNGGSTPPAWTQALSWWRVLLAHLVLAAMVAAPWAARVRVRDYGLRIQVPALEVQGRRVHLAGWVPYEIQGRKVWELEHVRPVAMVAAQVLGVPARPEKAREWVTVPRTYRDPEGDPVEVLLPAGFTGSDRGTQDRLVRAVAARLGMRDPVASWHLAGSTPRLELSAPAEPPARVTMAEVMAFLDASEEYRPFLGLVGKDRGLHAEMISDSPHIAVSAGPGAGKSTMAKLVAMQAKHWGWGLVILDWKMTEAYDWAKGLPGVTILTGIEAIHDFGVRIGEEVEGRKVSGLSGRAKVLVIRDEWNITAELLMAYWTNLRATAEPEDRRVMPVRSPSLQGFAKLDFAGREFGLFDFVIAQRLSARAFNGNADIRECFAIRCLARYSEQTKKMLVGNLKPFPKKSNVPGRWTIVAGEEVSVIQVPFITNQEAREYALNGAAGPVTPLSTAFYPGLTQPDEVDHGLETSLGHDPARPSRMITASASGELTVTDTRKLSDMVDGLAPLGVTLDILRNATKRPEEGFPLPVGGSPNRGYTYDFQAVLEWARRRNAARVAEKVTRP